MPRWGTFAAPTCVLGLWLVEQLLMTYVETWTGTAVAYSAHAAGFAFGAIVAGLLRASGADAALDHASGRAANKADWHEHPIYVCAMDARDRLEHDEARRLLLQLISELPQHAGAHEGLLDLYLDGATRSEDLHDVDISVPIVVEHYHRAGMDEALVALYRRIRRLMPRYGLSDQELLRIATAAQHRNEEVLVISAVGELIAEYPRSPVLPRAMLIAAETQGRSGAADLQRETLQRIVSRFPEHACAKLARDELASVST